jgi:MFS family permease
VDAADPLPRGSARFGPALTDYRNLIAIIGGLALMQAAVAGLSAFAPITLANRGASPFEIGIAAAGYGGGFLAGALRAVPVVRAIGHVRSFAGFAAIAAIAALALYPVRDLVPWLVLQAVLGFCVSTLLTSGESWIADVAPQERRGSLLAFYMIVSKLGQIAGPLVIASAAADDAAGFMAIGAMFAASLVPVSVTRRGHPAPPSAEAFGLKDLWRVAPAAVIAALVAGAVNGSVLALYAIYATGLNPDAGLGAAAAFNGAMAIGSVLAQWPAGLISDKYDRRMVIAALGIAGCVASAVLAFAGHILPWAGVLMVAALWGAGSMSFYGLAVAHGADRAAPGQATGMMAGILVVWAIGALAGPLIAGVAMSSPLGAGGLFAYSAVGLLLLSLAMVLRRAQANAAPVAEKAPFRMTPATSQSLVQIDPRADENPQLNLFESETPKTPAVGESSP